MAYCQRGRMVLRWVFLALLRESGGMSVLDHLPYQPCSCVSESFQIPDFFAGGG